MENDAFDPATSVLLSMDLQAGIVAAYAGHDPHFLNRVSRVLSHARRAGISVIHVSVGFRLGLPEVSPRNPLFGAIKTSPTHQKFLEMFSTSLTNEGNFMSTSQSDTTNSELSLTSSDIYRASDEGVLLRADADRLVQWGYEQRFNRSVLTEPKGLAPERRKDSISSQWLITSVQC